MTTWPELDFVQMSDEEERGGGSLVMRRVGAMEPGASHTHRGRTGWEDVVFEIGDDEALD